MPCLRLRTRRRRRRRGGILVGTRLRWGLRTGVVPRPGRCPRTRWRRGARGGGGGVGVGGGGFWWNGGCGGGGEGGWSRGGAGGGERVAVAASQAAAVT